MPRALWNGGVVPYEIEAGLPNAADVDEAMRLWTDATEGVISFRPRSEKADADYVEFLRSDRCYSPVGRRGGRQEIGLAPGCRVGVIQHEIGHAIGLTHEHSRPDRDTHVTVRWENISEPARGNFYPDVDSDEQLGTYDYASIMHYSRMSFSSNRSQTLELAATPEDLAELDVTPVGQRRQLSKRDVERVWRLYGRPAAAAAT